MFKETGRIMDIIVKPGEERKDMKERTDKSVCLACSPEISMLNHLAGVFTGRFTGTQEIRQILGALKTSLMAP